MIVRRRLGVSLSTFRDGSQRLRARLSMPRQGRVSWWLSSKPAPSDVWDAGAMRFHRGSDTAERANREIESLAAAVDEVFGRYELIERRVPTLQEAKRDIDEVLGLSTPAEDLRLRVSEVFKEFVTKQGERNGWASVTVDKFNVFAAHIEQFRPGLMLQDVDDALLEDYQRYMLEDLGFRNSTINKQVQMWRWFLRWAAAHGYYAGHSHETYRPRIKGVSASSHEIVYCTRDEVRRLMAYEPPASLRRIAKVRDVFVFCCFTGLRYSDVAKLRRCDVHGEEYISVVTKKTSDALRIELNAHSAAILRKYRDEAADPLSKALPVISNIKCNAYLKILGKEAGLDAMTRTLVYRGNERVEEFRPKWQLLTMHCARRTFVVTALQLGIPPEVIMRWTGHSSYEAMKPYVAIVDELKRRSMDKFDLF
ncbi:MAG: phage integrase SAM-like domain-containing protein [Marinilabiliaceae bacterium]